MSVRHPIPRTPAQKEALDRIELRHTGFRVGWRCTPEEIVRGALYRTAEDDENDRSCAEFTVYPNGEIQWWRDPPDSNQEPDPADKPQDDATDWSDLQSQITKVQEECRAELAKESSPASEPETT